MLTRQELSTLLRERGYKVTPQRLAVYEALSDETWHPNAEMLFRKLQPKFPAMSFATVYKTVEILHDIKAIQVLNTGEDSFRYDAETGARLSGLYNKLTEREMRLAILCGVGTMLLMVCIVSGKYSLRGSTYHYNFEENCNLSWLEKRDDYLRQTITRTANSSDSGGGSGGMGSSVHTSSSGSSHGGGVGRGF